MSTGYSPVVEISFFVRSRQIQGLSIHSCIEYILGLHVVLARLGLVV
jgi:hypothetical protein